MSTIVDRASSPRLNRLAVQGVASGLMIAALVILFFYVGKHVFEPLALAIFLSLALARVVGLSSTRHRQARLRHRHGYFGCRPAVLSWRKAGLIFSRDPRKCDLQIQAKG